MFNIFKNKNFKEKQIDQSSYERLHLLTAIDTYEKTLINANAKENEEILNYKDYLSKIDQEIINKINDNVKNGKFDICSKVEYLRKNTTISKKLIEENLLFKYADKGYKVLTYEEEDFCRATRRLVIKISWNKQ